MQAFSVNWLLLVWICPSKQIDQSNFLAWSMRLARAAWRWISSTHWLMAAVLVPVKLLKVSSNSYAFGLSKTAPRPCKKKTFVIASATISIDDSSDRAGMVSR
jgi:hypothetical protein